MSREHWAMSVMNCEFKKITIKDAAEQLNVSAVSIHNWIKDGSLQKTNNFLTQKDIDDFRNNFLNSKKLSSRANKQYKDLHNHNSLSKEIRKALKSSMSGDLISSKYESSLSESYKNKEGIYYTPQYIVEDMMKDIVDVESKTFLDPCCGSGNFIIEAIKKGFAPENVYGYDSDNIICANFLEIASVSGKSFDYIYTNPPFGKKISRSEKIKYSSMYNT